MEECLFCKIVRGEIASVKIWENDSFLAFLDIFPKVEGMTIVIPKSHFGSEVFNMPEEFYCDFLRAARTVALLLKEKLGAVRVFMVKEGAEINHAHIKLYPVKNKNILLQEVLEKAIEKQSRDNLEKVAKRIRALNN